MANDFVPEALNNANFRVLQPEGPAEQTASPVRDIKYVDEKGNPVDGPASNTVPLSERRLPPYIPPIPRVPRVPRSEAVVLHVHNHTHVMAPPEASAVGYDNTEPPRYAAESEQQEESRHTFRRALGTLCVIAAVVGIGYGARKELTGAPEHNPSANSAVPVPGSTETAAPMPDNAVEGIDPTSPSIDPNALSQTSPTAVATPTSKPITTSEKAPTPSTTHSVKVAPAPTTESAPTPTSETKTKTAHHVSYELPRSLANVISSTVDQGRLYVLENNNPQLRDFMNEQNLANTVNLSSITVKAMNNYRKENNVLSARYGEWEGGMSKPYNQSTLTERSEVAYAMIGQTDHVLEYAGYTYGDDPKLRVVDLAYWSRDLRNEARYTIKEALRENNDPSQTGYTEANGAAVLGITTRELKDGSTVNLVATWSDYGRDQDGNEVEKVRWELPVRINGDDDYVNVTVAEMNVRSQGNNGSNGNEGHDSSGDSHE